MPLFESSETGLTFPATTKAEGKLSFRLITNPDALEALAPAWQELLDDSASAEPMLSPTWLRTWLRVYGAGRTLHAGLFYEGERLVGLAPLCKRRHWYRPGIPLTRLEFLGSDVDEQDGVCSEYLNVVARAGYEETVTQRFVAAVQGGGFGHWHEIVLGAMNGADAGPALLRDAFSAVGYRAELTTTTDSPYLPLAENWDAYLKSMPKKKRHNLTHAWRHFQDWAGTEWALEEVKSADDLARGQQILWDLHSQRWREEGHAGAFASSRFSAFHQAYMPQLLREGKLDLFWLTVRGEPIAAHYQIVANDKVYFYQCGRRLDLPQKVRAGIVMVSLAIQRAMARGLREFDFLGGPAFYKTEFTKTTRPIVSLLVARPSVREWLRRQAERVILWVRALRRPAPPVSTQR